MEPLQADMPIATDGAPREGRDFIPQPRTVWQSLGGGVPILTVVTIAHLLGPMGLQAYSFGLFLKPLEEAFGWGLRDINLAFSCILLGQVVGGPVAGLMVDRYGARAMALVAVPAMALSTCALSAMNGSLAYFYAIGVSLGVGCAFAYVAYGKMINLMFQDHRGAALGIMAAGVGLAAIAGPVIIQPIIDGQGWAFGFLVLGLALLAVTPGLFIWFRQHQLGATSGFSAPLASSGLPAGLVMRQPIFWIFLLAFAFYGVAAGGVLPNLTPFLTEGGMTRGEAARYLGLLGLCTMLGRLCSGFLLDRLNGATMLALLTAAEAAAFISLGVYGVQFAFVAIVIYGFAHGSEIAALPFLTGRLFGMRSFGVLFGFANTAAFGGFALGPIFFSSLRENTGQFFIPFLVAAVLASTASMLLFVISRSSLLRTQPQKIAD